MTARLTKGADGRFTVTMEDYCKDWPQLSAEIRKMIPERYLPVEAAVLLDLYDTMDEVHRMVVAGEATDEFLDEMTDILRELCASKKLTRQ